MPNKIIRIFLSLLYTGDIKYGPGSFASFITLLFAWFFFPNDIFSQIQIILIILFLSMLLLYLYVDSDLDANKDPQYIVIDEVVGMMIALFLLPKIILAYLLAFLLFRFFDILKPSIIYESQKFDYGIGIILDDVLAGLLTLIILHGIF